MPARLMFYPRTRPNTILLIFLSAQNVAKQHKKPNFSWVFDNFRGSPKPHLTLSSSVKRKSLYKNDGGGKSI
jgi:hypothetical protein